MDNLQKHITCSKWIVHSSKASIHVNETASVIKMRSLDTIVYEQDSQMALSCFHYDSLFSQCFPMQKKGQNSVTLPENAQDSTIHYLYSHLKTTVKLHIAVVRGVSEYKTLNTYVSHFYCICSLQFYSIVQKKNTLQSLI